MARPSDNGATNSTFVLWKCIWFTAMLLAVPIAANAQASLQVPLEFNFLNPGARSLALGSAFVGLSDDATAAFTNPAGLTALAKPEFSIEGRGSSGQARFLDAGRLSGHVTNMGVDTITGAAYGNSDSNDF